MFGFLGALLGLARAMQITPRSLAPGVRIFSPFPQSLARAVRARAHGGWREVLCVQAGIEACTSGKSRVTAPRFAPSAPFFSTRARVIEEEAGRTSASAAHPGLDSRLRFDAAATAEGMAAEASVAAEVKPFAVLFACLWNICRSPVAEAVFQSLVSKRVLDSKFHIDSVGTIGYHEVVPCIYLAHCAFTCF